MCWYYTPAHAVENTCHILCIGEHFTTGGRHFCNYSAKLI